MKLKYLVISTCALLAVDAFSGKIQRERRLAAQRERHAPYPTMAPKNRPESGFSSTHGSKQTSPTDFSDSASFFPSATRGLEQEAAEGLLQLSKDPLSARRAYLQGIYDSYNAVLVVEDKRLLQQFLSNTIQGLLKVQKRIFDTEKEIVKNIRAAQEKGGKETSLEVQSLLSQEHALKSENDLVSGALGFFINAYNQKKFGRGSAELVKLWVAQVVENSDSLKNAGLREYPEFKGFGK